MDDETYEYIVPLGIVVIILMIYYMYGSNPKYNLYNGTYWGHYRLGDIINGYMIRSIDPQQKQYLRDVSTRWPNSIADKYIKNAGYPQSFKIWDLDIVVNILDEMNYEKPDKHTMVLHLRLGDVVGMWKDNKVENYMEDKNYYVKDLEYYKDLLTKIKKIRDIQRINIVTGTHHNQDIDESIKHLDHIVFIFDSDYDVNVKITNNPDKDFYYMCHSKYSNLVKDIVVRKGNIIL